MNDIYQERYMAHQKRKAESLMGKPCKRSTYDKKQQKLFFEILKNRSSQRVFNNEPIDINPVLEALETAPSSCDRKAVSWRVIKERKDKEILSGLLVGGVGWIHRGTIILLVADMTAYKSPAERDNMPYLDAGVLIQTAYLTAEAMNLGVCCVNPHIREENRKFFRDRFLKDNELFCGAIILG